MAEENRRVLVGKIDLDTVGTAFLLGVARADKVEVLRGGAASFEDLGNAEVICIEVGGSGRQSQNNWDHHGLGSESSSDCSATMQVWLSVGEAWQERFAKFAASVKKAGLVSFCSSSPWSVPWSVQRLVEYINTLDTEGPQSLGQKAEGLFPTLSDLFAGLLLTERDPVEQLHKGIELLRDVVVGGWDPYGSFMEIWRYVNIAKRV